MRKFPWLEVPMCVVILLVVGVVLSQAPSCTTITPPRTTATHTETAPDGTITETELASEGAGLKSFVRSPPKGFETGEAGRLSLPEGATGQATGGGADFFAEVGGGGPWPFIIGGLAVVAGLVIAFSVGQKKLGLSLAAGGAALLFLSYLLQAYAGWILIALLGAGALWLLLGSHLAGRLRLALDRIVRGVETHEPVSTGNGVKAEILKAAGGAEPMVRKEVTKSKKRQNLE